jgi:hypothetical protein
MTVMIEGNCQQINMCTNCIHFVTKNTSIPPYVSPQPYRTTPLILPGAKNNLQKNLPTESYLRHHPNPQMRGPPTHDFSDIMMKQKVADSVLQRVVGNQYDDGNQYQHQQQHNGPKV